VERPPAGPHPHQPPGTTRSRPRRIGPELTTRVNIQGKTFTSATMTFPPGDRAVPHRHGNAFVYAYVLEGAIRSQLEGEPMRTCHQGENWIELPGPHHVATENAGNTEPAEFLVVFVVVALREFSKPVSMARWRRYLIRLCHGGGAIEPNPAEANASG
jgi:quercetin dioxygenase-like cupin family protein